MFQTQLKEVSVYRAGCVTRRTASVPLKAGKQTVRLSGLSGTSDGASLRLHVPEGVTGSNVQVEYRTADAREEEKKALTEAIARLKRDLGLKQKYISFWEKNAIFTERQTDIAEMTAYLEKLPERMESLYRETDALTAEIAEKEKALRKLQETLNLPYVTAELTAEADGTYPVMLTVLEHAANWNPVYEIHAEDGTDSLLLRLRATLRQDTGEDWEGVRVTLYTGNPTVSGTIPVLNPVYLRIYERPLAKGRIAMPTAMKLSANMARDEAVAGGAMEESVMMADADFGTFSEVNAGSGTAVQGDTMTEYALSGTWDVKKGQEIVLDIEEKTLPCRYHTVAVPKYASSAFLAAEVKSVLLTDLQNTEASVYLKGTYTGRVYLCPDLAEETYDLSLGTDETVKIRRTKKKEYTSTVLLKGQKKTEYEYETVITSAKAKTADITVLDQVPLSGDKTIVVEKGDLSGGKEDEKTGIIRWSFRLEPKASKTIRLSWQTAWPKDKEIRER